MAQELGESVFLNIPYDKGFEPIYLAYVTGLTVLGLKPKLTAAVPNSKNRLETIIKLLETCAYSIHDLSRVESTNGMPRFNMPLELGLALYREWNAPDKHGVYVFEQKSHRIQQSTSDLNGMDPFIHNGSPEKVMSGLRSIFQREANRSTVPKMMKTYDWLIQKLPIIQQNAGTDFLFDAAVFHDIVLTLSLRLEKRAATRGDTKC